MSIYDTLYKLDSKKKLRIWRMERDGDKYRTISGLDEGKQTTSAWTVAKPKNVGRSNATTGEQQAHLEVTAKYTKKLEQGAYHKTKGGVSKGASYTQPMLAQTFYREDTMVKDKLKKKTVLEFPVQVQNKLDGIRCIAKLVDGEVKLFTRKGKPIVSVPHVQAALHVVLNKNPETILDGELYAHHLKDDFQRITSLVRKQSTAKAITDQTVEVEYHVYDQIQDTPFWERSDDLGIMLTDAPHSVIKFVPYDEAEDEEELDDFHLQAVGAGYEGSMIRSSPNMSTYEMGKRSKLLLKRKDFDTDEFTIMDVLEGKGNRSGMAGKLVYQTAEGGEFESGLRGNFDYFRELLRNKKKYIGREATVRYFGFTDDNLPRFAVTIDIHDGKRND